MLNKSNHFKSVLICLTVLICFTGGHLVTTLLLFINREMEYNINGIPVHKTTDYIAVRYSPVLPNRWLKLYTDSNKCIADTANNANSRSADSCTAHTFPNGFLGHKTLYYNEQNIRYVQMLLTSFVLW